MSVPPATRTRRTLVPLVIVTAAALLFTLLLLLVRLRWAPLESADHGAATGLNSLIAGHPVAVSIVEAVTWLGSSGVLWTLTGAAAILLAVRRQWRLAAYLLVVGVGELVLDPVLKALVARLRDRGASVVLATHDDDLRTALADRVIDVRDGKVSEIAVAART